MQIVIDIPESVYGNTKRYGINKVWKDTEIIEEAIISGIVLPEPHGRLIDADDIGLTDFEIISCDGDYKQVLKLICKKIDNAPTIIEADNAESQDKECQEKKQ